MPPELTARDARADDHPHFVRFFAELVVDDPVPDAATWAAHLAPRSFFVEEGDRPVGYVQVTRMRETGYVTHVVVDPGCRGRGIGVALMRETARRLLAAGCSRWRLNVKKDNEPAIRLYERVGMRAAYASTSLRVPWEGVSRLPAPSRPLEARVLRDDDDAAIEAAFDLASGQLAAYRSRPGMLLFRLVDPSASDDPTPGMARFMPSFPGAFPLRVAEPSFASALFACFRPHALPGQGHLFVVTEGDEALRRLLCAAGAEVQSELWHYRGEITEGTIR